MHPTKKKIAGLVRALDAGITQGQQNVEKLEQAIRASDAPATDPKVIAVVDEIEKGWSMTEQTPDAPCEWKEDEDGVYDTACRQRFTFIDGGPKVNNMKFCCYCGKALHETRYQEPTDDDE